MSHYFCVWLGMCFGACVSVCLCCEWRFIYTFYVYTCIPTKVYWSFPKWFGDKSNLFNFVKIFHRNILNWIKKYMHRCKYTYTGDLNVTEMLMSLFVWQQSLEKKNLNWIYFKLNNFIDQWLHSFHFRIYDEHHKSVKEDSCR